jgi:Na+-driven multidrug efflux pump
VVAIATRALGLIAPAYAAFGAGMAMYFACQGAGRMGWPVAGALSRFLIAIFGGALLAGPLGLEGQFLAVALGITAYGVLTALSVRPAVWR